MSLKRLRRWMEAEGVEAAYLTNPVSIASLTGFRTHPFERLMALAVGPDAADLIVPSLELESARAAATGVEVRAWHDGQDPYALVARALGAAPARLALEKDHLSVAGYERLGAAVHPELVVDATPELRAIRLRKGPDEIERLTEAARLTDLVTERVMDRLVIGQSELEVSLLIAQAIAEAGAGPSFESLVQFGPDSAQPHLHPSGRRLREGELVLLDFGAAWQGYCADTTRMAVAGSPDGRQAEVHRVVLEAHDQALDAARPGVTAGQVDEAARAVIRKAGYGELFIHRVGHGLGLEAHEPPSLDPGSDLLLEPGMVITIEPGIYIPGWGGVRVEDDAVIEESGARLLTQAARDLRVIGPA
jgi:Xaa-Pro dipeptidase